MSMRAMLMVAFLAIGIRPLHAAECPVPVYAPQAGDQIVEWFGKFIEPSRALAGIAENPRPTKEAVETLIGKLDGLHRRAVSDPLYFEPLVRLISAKYADAGDFKDLTSPLAKNLYSASAGADLDFTALCIDTRRSRFSEDTFTITLSGVNSDNCQHVTLRGLVFTSTLINGSANGECRPDHTFYRMLFVPILAGTNSVTFVCNKDTGGCARH